MPGVGVEEQKLAVEAVRQGVEDGARRRSESHRVTKEVTVEGARTMTGLPGDECEDATGYRYCGAPCIPAG